MLFNSWHFILFFALVLVLNQFLRRWPTAQKLMLLTASYYFYGQWSWMYLGLILASTVTDFTIGRGFAHVRHPRRLMILSLVVNLGLLGFFKYANWLIANINGSAELIDAAWRITPLDIMLPVGISFYTFQSLSYTIDVYRGSSPPRKSLLDYALFVVFFPQLVAGPIVRDNEFFAQLDGEQRVDAARVQRGLTLIAFGFLKKMVFADSLALAIDPVFADPAAAGFWDTLLAVYGFAFQIYFDFSGYTDIAIGAALLLGFEFPQNFNYPYAATSIQDFWRRWHMTLSRWLRDYLYVSLGGNRHGLARTYLALMLTMLLGGLWHGASWNFVIWGALHGSYLAIERAFLFKLPFWNSPNRVWQFSRWLLTFHLVCFAWIFFRAQDLASAGTLLSKLFATPIEAFPRDALGAMATLIVALLVAHRIGSAIDWKAKLATDRGPRFALALGGIVLLLIWFTPQATVPFIYFQF